MDEELIEEDELEEFKDPSFNEDDSSETPPTDIVDPTKGLAINSVQKILQFSVQKLNAI